MDIETIQTIIDERAEKRLNARVDNLINGIRNDNDFMNFIADYKIKVKENEINLRVAFWDNDSSLMREFKKSIREKFIAAESREFVKRVDELQNELEDLKNGINVCEY
jgi:hypothetical protein